VTKDREFTFRPGDVVSRERLHRLFGGQERGGISTPRGHPYIFLFTGARGEAYGHEHAWEGDIYHYTGEGQRGDMEFTPRNRALRDHAHHGKRVFLFQERPDGKQEFVGEMVVRSWRHKTQKDRSGKERNGIVFELARAGSSAAAPYPDPV